MRKFWALRRALMSAPMVLAFANFACVVGSDSPSEKLGQAKSRIIGGTDATPGEFPWMVSITRGGTHSCGGALLTSRHVLTAAHCVEGTNASLLGVVAGLHMRSDLTGAQTSAVETYVTHQNYNVGEAAYANDLAIVTLSTPITVGGNVQLAVLPANNSNNYVGATCQVVGWGRTGTSNILPDILQKASIPVISTDEANSLLTGVNGATVWDNQLALYDNANNVTISNGDSGGIVVCPDGESRVVGIQSWGVSNSMGNSLATYPALATKTGAYLDWINNNLDDGGATGPVTPGIQPTYPPSNPGPTQPPSTVDNQFIATVTGTVHTFPEELPVLNPPPGYVPPAAGLLKNRPLKVVLTYWATQMDYVLVKGLVCAPVTITDTAWTNSAGVYNWSYNLPARCGEHTPRITVSAGMGESTTNVDSSVTFAYRTVNGNIEHAPHLAYGGLWVRKLGNGKHPVIFTEGFDPGDTYTSEQSCPVDKDGNKHCAAGGIIGLMRASPLPLDTEPADKTKNFLDYMLAHDMSVYLILTGKNYGQSIRGLAAKSEDGSAFAAAYLMQKIVEVYHPTPSGTPRIQAVVGGFSMGGLIVKNALNRWCAGDWEGVFPDGFGLQHGCQEISAWYSADAPLEGANYPIALQRYIKDFEVSEGDGKKYAPEFNWPAAREMFKQWVTDGCNTNCAPDFLGFDWDFGGCKSIDDADFKYGCHVDNTKRNEFVAWEMSAGNASTAHGVPWRTGLTGGDVLNGPVPAVAISLGLHPENPSRAMAHQPHPNQDGTYDPVPVGWSGPGCLPGEQLEFVHTFVDEPFGDHELYTNTADGTDECVHGSYMDTMYNDMNIFGTKLTFDHLTVVKFAPTFMASSSALNWSRAPAHQPFSSNPSGSTPDAPGWWLDHWSNDKDGIHVHPFPAGAVRFLLGWISEYAIGTKDKPYCNRPFPTFGAKGKCRSELKQEISGNDIDENGDDNNKE